MAIALTLAVTIAGLLLWACIFAAVPRWRARSESRWKLRAAERHTLDSQRQVDQEMG
jgi:hypothetical protein